MLDSQAGGSMSKIKGCFFLGSHPSILQGGYENPGIPVALVSKQDTGIINIKPKT